MLLLNPFRFAVAGGGDPDPLIADAVDFDGTDALGRTTALTSQANSVSGIFSIWIQIDPFDATFPNFGYILQSLNSGTENQQVNATLVDLATADPDGQNTFFYIEGYDSVFNPTFNVNCEGPHSGFDLNDDGTTWHHILVSWDGATGSTHLYVDDVDQKNTAALEFTGPSFADNVATAYADATHWGVGELPPLAGWAPSTDKFNGGMAELYFAPGQYLDFSVESNRRKFRTALGKPADLGATGSAPTGSIPLIYLHIDDAEAAANFVTNNSGNGDFTVTEGTLSTRGTSPSD